MRFLQSQDLGFEKEGVVSFEFFNEDYSPETDEEFDVMINKLTRVNNELGQSSLIKAVGSSEFPIFDSFHDCWEFDENPEQKVSVFVGGACSSFPALFGIEVLEGRFFSETRKQTMLDMGVVVNQTAAKQLFSGDAVGKVFTMASWGMVEVLGVVEDFNYQHLSKSIEPLILYHTTNEAVPVVRFEEGKLKEGMKFVQDLHTELDTGVPFSYEFLDQELGELYEKDKAITKLMSTLSTLALVIASLGLFALSAYAVELRVKEISIRKVNGARVSNIFSLLSRDFLKWVVYAMVIAMPLAWYFMDYWLQNYAYRTDISWWIFVMAGTIILLVSWITISYHTSRAAITNPVDVLRSE